MPDTTTTDTAGEPGGAGDHRASMLRRMTDIIELFDGPHTRMHSGAIAASAGLPRSTTHRILDELIQLGWLVRTGHGYGLGPRILGIPGPSDQLTLRAAAAPLLQVLHEETGIVAHLAVPDEADIIVVDKVGGRVVHSIPTRVGDRIPIHTTGMGKAILARYPAEAVDQLLPATLDKRTAGTISTRLGLHHELHRIRRREGLAFGNEESSAGVCCAAASFPCPDGTSAAIAVSGRAALHHLERVGPLVHEAARRISARLSAEETPESGAVTEGFPPAAADSMMIKLLSTINGDDWI